MQFDRGDVDDAVLSGKGNCGLRTFFGQWEQPFTGPTCQQYS